MAILLSRTGISPTEIPVVAEDELLPLMCLRRADRHILLPSFPAEDNLGPEHNSIPRRMTKVWRAATELPVLSVNGLKGSPRSRIRMIRIRLVLIGVDDCSPAVGVRLTTT